MPPDANLVSQAPFGHVEKIVDAIQVQLELLAGNRQAQAFLQRRFPASA